jgi:hypothetical protein
MVSLMNTWQKKYVASAMLLLFLGPLFGLLQPLCTNSVMTTPLKPGSIYSTYVPIGTTSELNALSDTIVTDSVFVDPTANIIGAILSNFTINGGYSFNVYNTTATYTVSFSIVDSIFNTEVDDGFNMRGSPTISGTNVYISGPLQSNSYPAQIGSPTLSFDNVNASKIQFHVSGGNFIWNHSQTTSLVLNGFTTAILDSDNITTGLWVEGSGIVYIFNTQINGTIHESVKPIISGKTHYSVPYSFVFQPQVQVKIDLGGHDNIRGPAYDLSYTLNIYKNGIFQETISNFLEDSYSLTMDTTASYEIRVTCEDQQGNVSTEAIISIIPQADLLWFILMIVFIAAGAVGAIAIFYLWKQRQWQKTSLVEIPA